MVLGLVAAIAFQRQAVSFLYDSSRLKSIQIGDACILGTDIRTGGAYLIGSADGSDAQGRSVISVGAFDGKMKSDNPRLVASPPFRIHFEKLSSDRLGFDVRVGPVSQDFATISFPFDFGLKMMDRFSFGGDHYQIFCAENDGSYQGSGARFDAIRPRCEIRDIHNTLIGKVGGASTEAPTPWAEVDGPYATVRVTVKSSQHYEKLVFMNHPGTHNLEFSFGRMKKGESAAISGEIAVTPKAGPNTWVFDAAKEFNHQVGRAEGDGWSVSVGDPTERYMCFGPYATEIGRGPRTAKFTAMLDNVTADDERILTFDVADATSGRVLASRDVTRRQFSRPFTYQEFALSFVSPPDAKLEFRTLWHGVSYARIKGVEVTK